MKILKLRFLNLNSLYGEWEIDFTSPEYVSNGIFAITGATGAGKSTILDAICLALYGSTPRLNIISKSTNEIMSRKTGECFAEVTFRVNTGLYTCHWSQHRARKSSDGKLSDSKHEISDTNTGKVLANKKRDVSNLVIEKSGMDLDRFTRSILLAQGSFSAFLKATADERAPILEQITGTEIYSDISKKIHERQRLESDKYSILVAETEGITFLSDEVETQLKVELNQANTSEKVCSDKNTQLNNFILWKNRILNLEKECEHLSQSHKTILVDIDNFKPRREFLNKAIKAGELDGDYAIFNNLFDIQIKEKEILSSIGLELPLILKDQKQSEEKYKESESKLLQLKDFYTKEQDLIKRVREMDYDIHQRTLLMDERNSDFNINIKNVEVIEGQISKLQEKRLNVEKESLVINEYLENNRNSSELVLGLSGLKHRLEIYKNDIDKLYFKEIDVKNQDKKITELEQDKVLVEKSHGSIIKDRDTSILNIKDENKNLIKLLNGRLLREYRAELKSLIKEKGLLVKISSLEEERKNLRSDIACPLCGSKDHPYAKGYSVNLDEADVKIKTLENLISQVEESEFRIKELEKKDSQINKLVTESEKSLFTIGLELDEAYKNINRLKEEFKELSKESEAVKESLELSITKYTIEEIDFDDIDNLIILLDKKSNLWLEYSNKSEGLISNLKEFESSIKRFQDDLEIKKIEIKSNKIKMEDIKSQFDLSVKTRKELYGVKDPEVQEQRLNAEIKSFEGDIKSLRIVNEQLTHKFVELNTRNESLKSSINIRDKKLEELDLKLQTSYKKLGFVDKVDFLKHRISRKERDSLLNRVGELDSSLSSIIARKRDRELNLENELDKKLTERDLPELKEDLNSSIKESKIFGEKIGAMKQQLQNNFDSMLKIKEKEEKIKAQKVECENWQKLHSLIGSADGKRFRNFAQGLTFEQMVFFANRELVKLSDRYLLIRDKDSPLELNVIDNYQAGEIRSTKNLSGGESFIISLSLALGLSRMASNKVRVDSLFLDEGFGTLDEEALETALDTLSGLHQDGKLIGVISHIPALKKRILTQINIRKNAGGRGSISGPGCKHL